MVNKGQRDVVEADGKQVKKKKRNHGYKTHAPVDTETDVATRVASALGKSAGNACFREQLHRYRALDGPTTAYAGDKAIDGADIFALIRACDVRAAFA